MKKNPKIIIVDYGLSNLYSISKALERFSDNIRITDEPSVLESADAAVLPGVGSFEEGMKGLERRGLAKSLQNFANSGKPLLGICLGAQLLLKQGYEFGVFEGLNIIDGEVVKFSDTVDAKIPHIGWNELYAGEVHWSGTILDEIKERATMYFVHSYILRPSRKQDILALSEYGGHEFCSIIRKENVYGCQFHPEKSGEVGLHILKNFVEISSTHS